MKMRRTGIEPAVAKSKAVTNCQLMEIMYPCLKIIECYPVLRSPCTTHTARAHHVT
jgi:hypothetical protein